MQGWKRYISDLSSNSLCWVLSAHGRCWGWSPKPRVIRFQCKFSENATVGTGPGRSPWCPWQAPLIKGLPGFPTLFDLIFWKFHSVHFCRLIKWQAFLLNTECLCNHKHKLVFHLGTSIWDFVWYLCLRHRDPEKKGAGCGKIWISSLRQEKIRKEILLRQLPLAGCRTWRDITDEQKNKLLWKYKYCKMSVCFIKGSAVCFTHYNITPYGRGIGHHHHFTNGKSEVLRN